MVAEHPDAHRRAHRPPKVHEQHDRSTAVARFNAAVAVRVTEWVGSMWAAYVFAILALFGLPGALDQGVVGTVQWIAQTFLQLVLLSVILVASNLQAAASDARADATYHDTESLLDQHNRASAMLDEIKAEIAELRTLAAASARSGLVELHPRQTPGASDEGPASE